MGAGGAGCVLAAKLSEQFNVLLLEKGGDPVPATKTPFFVTYSNDVYGDPVINDLFTTVQQTNSALQKNGVGLILLIFI